MTPCLPGIDRGTDTLHGFRRHGKRSEGLKGHERVPKSSMQTSRNEQVEEEGKHRIADEHDHRCPAVDKCRRLADQLVESRLSHLVYG